MNRQRLGSLVRALWILLIFAFLAVLFASLDVRIEGSKSTASNANDSAPEDLFSDVFAGQTKMRRYQGTRVWVTRLTKQQIKLLSDLSVWVKDPSAGCAVEQSVCVLEARSQRDGVDIVYSATEPSTLPAQYPWHGGFVDPADGSHYDLLGRAYKRGTSMRNLSARRQLIEVAPPQPK